MLGAKAAAQLLNVGTQALYRYREAGMPAHKIGKRWKFKAAEITEWYAKHRPVRQRYGPHSRKPAEADTDAGDDEQDDADDLSNLTAAQLQDELARAKLAEIKARTAKHEHELAVKRGEMLHRDDVMAGRLKRIHACKAGLIGLKAKLPAVLVGLSESEIAALLEREVDELLERFAGKADA